MQKVIHYLLALEIFNNFHVWNFHHLGCFHPFLANLSVFTHLSYWVIFEILSFEALCLLWPPLCTFGYFLAFGHSAYFCQFVIFSFFVNPWPVCVLCLIQLRALWPLWLWLLDTPLNYSCYLDNWQNKQHMTKMRQMMKKH